MYSVGCLHLRHSKKTGSFAGTWHALFSIADADSDGWSANLVDIIFSIQFPFLSGNRSAYDNAMACCFGKPLSSTAPVVCCMGLSVYRADSGYDYKTQQRPFTVDYTYDEYIEEGDKTETEP